LRVTDSWLIPIRDSLVGLVIWTIVALCLFLLGQASRFDHDLGSGLATVPAIALTIVLMAMTAGLIFIAVLPQRDPLSLPINGRKAYVYVAQLMLVLLGAHVYLSMPWLLKSGILKYWPYLAMVLAFGGILLSRLLQRRKLSVLADPIMLTAALLPVLASIGFHLIGSRADGSLTLMLASGLYLTIFWLSHADRIEDLDQTTGADELGNQSNGLGSKMTSLWSGLLALLLVVI